MTVKCALSILALAATLTATSTRAQTQLGQDTAAFDQEIAKAKAAMMGEPGKAYAHAIAAARLVQGSAQGQPNLRLVTAQWLTGEALIRLQRPKEALPALDAAFHEVAKVAPDSKLEGDVLKSQGRAYEAVGRIQPALENFQRAYEIYQRAHEPRGEAMALQEIGSIYSDARDYPHVLEYNAQARDVYGQDPALTLSADNNRGFALKDMGRYAEAEGEFHKALDAASKMHSGYLKANILENVAFTEALDGKRSSARDDVNRGLQLAAKDPEARPTRPFLLGVMAKILADGGQPAAAAHLLDEVFAGVDLNTSTMAYRDFHQIAADVYERVGDSDKALKHQKAFKRLDDQGRALAASTNAALIGAKFDFANQTAKISQLKAGELQRDIILARSKARFAIVTAAILICAGLLVLALLAHAFFTMRRSRNKVSEVNGRLETTNSALEKALKAKTEFLAMTSHEIRTPLNGILGMTQVMLADPAISTETRERLQVVKSSGLTMNALVTDILDVAKMETGNTVIERQEFDLHDLLGQTVRMWRDKAHSKGLAFEADTTECPRYIVEDADRLRQILSNLISNATKFTEKGAVGVTVGVTGSSDQEWLVLDIRDTGVGIAPDQHERIFESFTQVDGAVSRKFEGTGLGLAICRNLVEALGGTVSLQSELGAGSTFRVQLPLTRGAGRCSEANESGRSLNMATLLVLEDNPLAQSNLRRALKDAVRSLEFAGTVEQMVRAAPLCSAVLVDGGCLLRLFPENPMAQISRLRSAIATPIVVTWPALNADDAVRLSSLGADEVLSKPLSAANLIAGLQKALQDFQSIQALTEAA